LPGGAGSVDEGEPAAAAGDRAAAPAPAAGSAVLGYTTGARASGADVGASQTVTLLAPRGGGGGQEAAAARRRGGAQGPSAGLPGGSYSQPALHKVGAFQLAAMQARPRPPRACRAPRSVGGAGVGWGSGSER